MTPRQSEIADRLAQDIRAKLLEYGPILFGKRQHKFSIDVVPSKREDNYEVHLKPIL